jgi:hypothetical protein
MAASYTADCRGGQVRHSNSGMQQTKDSGTRTLEDLAKQREGLAGDGVVELSYAPPFCAFLCYASGEAELPDFPVECDLHFSLL